MCGNEQSGWRIYLLALLLIAFFAQLTESTPIMFNMLTKRGDTTGIRNEMIDFYSKRSLDFCGCNMGCFYQSASQCASCCALGI
ncbi:unnamed protein product [Bursaphelenchus xylophilus]|uniref:(pine wood nematode) hypothetical protein n=1 Tax=Bursaphelenchus xylophilus TaxID=6326 RepID=A0A1I7SS28_BURXY|nr:unnamed protein product [Bursaphelenchus xylophilus]CAG9105757.1 unnamed protein product [Bursaphelenchus xylophilus]